VDDVELLRMDRGLAGEAERAGELGLVPQPQIVVETQVDAVDRRRGAATMRERVYGICR
jgi:hypothetical protein